MQVSSIMSCDVEIIPPEATIQDAAEKMKSLNVGSLPVCDGAKLLGIITDRDITVRATAEGRGPQAKVKEAMTPGITYCYEDEDVREAARIMEEKQIRRLPILNRDKRLVGFVSLGDIAVEGRDDKLSGEILERVSEPLQ